MHTRFRSKQKLSQLAGFGMYLPALQTSYARCFRVFIVAGVCPHFELTMRLPRPVVLPPLQAHGGSVVVFTSKSRLLARALFVSSSNYGTCSPYGVSSSNSLCGVLDLRWSPLQAHGGTWLTCAVSTSKSPCLVLDLVCLHSKMHCDVCVSSSFLYATRQTHRIKLVGSEEQSLTCVGLEPCACVCKFVFF